MDSPEVSTKAVDAAARNVIDNAGYGKYFIHGTGHGVGRKIHQLPKIGPRATGYKLRASMVITIDPASICLAASASAWKTLSYLPPPAPAASPTLSSSNSEN